MLRRCWRSSCRPRRPAAPPSLMLIRALLAPISSLISFAAAALCQHAHLAGDDREATALSTGPRGFYCGIQRQQISLECDRIDDGDDVFDAVRRFADRAHRVDDLADYGATLC